MRTMGIRPGPKSRMGSKVQGLSFYMISFKDPDFVRMTPWYNTILRFEYCQPALVDFIIRSSLLHGDILRDDSATAELHATSILSLGKFTRRDKVVGSFHLLSRIWGGITFSGDLLALPTYMGLD